MVDKRTPEQQEGRQGGRRAAKIGAAAGVVAAGIPAPFLVSLRMATFKYERPLWNLLLMHEKAWPMPLPVVVYAFTALVFGFVGYVLTWLYNDDPGGGATSRELAKKKKSK
jgi:hypothetical protein